MIDKALFCKRQGNFEKAIKILNKAIKIESNNLGLSLKGLKSKSYVEVKHRPQVTKSTDIIYNTGDYYFNKLGLIWKRGEQNRAFCDVDIVQAG